MQESTDGVRARAVRVDRARALLSGCLMEAIILAGGFGKRLRSVISDLTNPIAPVAGRSFLALLLGHPKRPGFKRVILAVGYMHSLIVDYFKTHPAPLELRFSIETEPLVIGGAVKLAMRSATADNVFVLNTDTFVLLSDAVMLKEHFHHGATASSALGAWLLTAHVAVPSGLMSPDASSRSMKKGKAGRGVVNAGAYVLNRRWVSDQWSNGAFSLERDTLINEAANVRIYGLNAFGMFLDIGTPKSYAAAARFVHLIST